MLYDWNELRMNISQPHVYNVWNPAIVTTYYSLELPTVTRLKLCDAGFGGFALYNGNAYIMLIYSGKYSLEMFNVNV